MRGVSRGGFGPAGAEGEGEEDGQEVGGGCGEVGPAAVLAFAFRRKRYSFRVGVEEVVKCAGLELDRVLECRHVRAPPPVSPLRKAHGTHGEIPRPEILFDTVTTMSEP